MIADRLMQ